jgi:hypothetical protein
MTFVSYCRSQGRIAVSTARRSAGACAMAFGAVAAIAAVAAMTLLPSAGHAQEASSPGAIPHSPAAPAASAPATAAASAPASAPVSGTTGASGDLVIRTIGAISYVCGGVAEDEQRQLASREKNFNMGLLFTQGAHGEFLSDVDVRLVRDGHETAKFRATGPRCLIKAPEGSYNVQAVYNGQSKSVVVKTGTRNTQIRW